MTNEMLSHVILSGAKNPLLETCTIANRQLAFGFFALVKQCSE